MRSLLFEELNPDEIDAVENYLKSNTKESLIEGLYWLVLPCEILTEDQKITYNNTGDLKIAIELGKTWVKFELLIRTSSLRNIGGGLINTDQLLFIYNFADSMSNSLNLISCI
jgi:hypothetical protein